MAWLLIRFLPVVALVAGCALATPASGAEAVSNAPDPASYDCTEHPVAPDGSRRQTFASFDPVGGLAAIPPRINTQLLPGESDTYCIGFQNRGSETTDLKIEVVDLAADDQGLPASQREAADRGASSWLSVPTERIVDLGSGDVAWLQVDVRVPDDALAGSSYASILGTGDSADDDIGAGGGAQVQSIPSVASQLFFDIPGDAERAGEVTDIRSPRVIWWDGFGVGDLPLLEDLRGLGVATIRFNWNNTGSFTSDIGGQLAIRSDLSDKSVARLGVPEQVVLAGTERRFEVTWQDDIPLLGRFTPVLEVQGDSGRVERHELDPIWVIPSWWYLLALALAIGIPLWLRRRNRQRYQELLARVEAAEASAADDDDLDDDWR